MTCRRCFIDNELKILRNRCKVKFCLHLKSVNEGTTFVSNLHHPQLAISYF